MIFFDELFGRKCFGLFIFVVIHKLNFVVSYLLLFESAKGCQEKLHLFV